MAVSKNRQCPGCDTISNRPRPVAASPRINKDKQRSLRAREDDAKQTAVAEAGLSSEFSRHTPDHSYTFDHNAEFYCMTTTLPDTSHKHFHVLLVNRRPRAADDKVADPSTCEATKSSSLKLSSCPCSIGHMATACVSSSYKTKI